MTWEPRPRPDVTPETERYWEAAADGRLLLQQCTDCGWTYHYPRAFCPECLSANVEWIESQGQGEVYSYSVTDEAEGWPEPHLPLIPAYIQLDEGVRLFTNLVDCDPSAVSVGTKVEVSFVPTEDDTVAIPVFSPVG